MNRITRTDLRRARLRGATDALDGRPVARLVTGCIGDTEAATSAYLDGYLAVIHERKTVLALELVAR